MVTTRSLALTISLLLACTARAEVAKQSSLQAEITRQVWSAEYRGQYRTGGVGTGKQPDGGPPIEIAAGVLEVSKTIDVYGEMDLIGKGRRTVIRNASTQPVFKIKCDYWPGHGMVRNLVISDLMIDSPNAPALVIDEKTVGAIENLTIRNCSFNTPRNCALVLIVDGNRAIRCYTPRIENCDFNSCYQAMRINSFGGVWRDSRIQQTNDVQPRPSGMIELHGMMSFEGASKFDGVFGCPFFDVQPYALDDGIERWNSILLYKSGHLEGAFPIKFNAAAGSIISRWEYGGPRVAGPDLKDPAVTVTPVSVNP